MAAPTAGEHRSKAAYLVGFFFVFSINLFVLVFGPFRDLSQVLNNPTPLWLAPDHSIAFGNVILWLVALGVSELIVALMIASLGKTRTLVTETQMNFEDLNLIVPMVMLKTSQGKRESDIILDIQTQLPSLRKLRSKGEDAPPKGVMMRAMGGDDEGSGSSMTQPSRAGNGSLMSSSIESAIARGFENSNVMVSLEGDVEFKDPIKLGDNATFMPRGHLRISGDGAGQRTATQSAAAQTSPDTEKADEKRGAVPGTLAALGVPIELSMSPQEGIPHTAYEDLIEEMDRVKKDPKAIALKSRTDRGEPGENTDEGQDGNDEKAAASSEAPPV